MTRRQSKPKVLVIGPVGAVGGMATSMRLQLGGELAQQYKMIPLDNSKRTPPDRPLWQGVRSQLGLLWKLNRLLARHRPELVHVHTCSGLTFYRTIVDMLIVRLHGMPVILHIRGGRFEEFLNGRSAIGRRVVRWALVSADSVIALSPIWAERLLAFDSRISVQVVANGVPLPERPRQHRPTARIRIVFVGTTQRAKGVDDLIEALSRLPKQTRRRIDVRIIGTDPSRRIEELQALAEQRGLSESVVFTGELSSEEVKGELRRAAIFTLPSYAEGLPNALLEAMACGLPAVVGSVGAVPEVIDHGVSGFLVRPGDIEQLSTLLGKLIRSPALRQKMGRAARKRVRQEFGLSKVARLLDALYQQLLKPAEA